MRKKKKIKEPRFSLGSLPFLSSFLSSYLGPNRGKRHIKITIIKHDPFGGDVTYIISKSRVGPHGFWCHHDPPFRLPTRIAPPMLVGLSSRVANNKRPPVQIKALAFLGGCIILEARVKIRIQICLLVGCSISYFQPFSLPCPCCCCC